MRLLPKTWAAWQAMKFWGCIGLGIACFIGINWLPKGHWLGWILAATLLLVVYMLMVLCTYFLVGPILEEFDEKIYQPWVDKHEQEWRDRREND